MVATSLWLAFAGPSEARAAPPDAAAFGRVPAMQSLALSPNGERIAWVEHGGARPVIQVLDVARHAQVNRVDVPGDLKVSALNWADDEILLIHADVAPTFDRTDSRGYTWHRTVAMEVGTGKSRVLLHTCGHMHHGDEAHLLALRTSRPHKVVMSASNVDGVFEQHRLRYEPMTRTDLISGHHLYEVDTLTGEGTVVGWGQTVTHGWVVDADGQPVVRVDRYRRKVFSVRHRRSSGWVEIFRGETGEIPELLGLTRDGSSVLMRASLNGKYVAIWRLPLTGGTPLLAVGDETDDIGEWVRDPYSLEVLGAWSPGLEPKMHWIDAQAEKRASSLRKTFGGKHVVPIGRSANGERVLVAVGSHAAPVTYYLVDFKQGTADIVGEQYPELVDVPLGEVRALTFKARDGYEIPAYLTLPPATAPSKLPLVVLPHDWPEGRDEATFHPLAQFLATRGYAVLQPQFRGSGGFGEAHRIAGYRQWGGLMQDDVSDGVRAMIEQGVADPKRVCIAGVLYGGYAALAGAAFTPELYSCAISVNGIADVPELIAHLVREVRGDDRFEAELEETIGKKRDVAAKSPVRAAANVKVPVLLIHGTQEAIPIAQSQAMMKALGGRTPHELIELPGEGLWRSNGAAQVRVLTEMERFLAKHLPAGQNAH